jgi:Tfp pilus assembly protein PilF
MSEADAYNDLGYIHMQQGNVDAAYELFEKAIAVSPSFHVKANENLRRLKSGELNSSDFGR